MSNNNVTPTPSPPARKLPTNFVEYENGKHRRYELLFKVNGAAFAIASFAGDPKKATLLYSILGLRTLAWGMIGFTVFMGIDIFFFGWGMKQLDDQDVKKSYPFTLGREV